MKATYEFEIGTKQATIETRDDKTFAEAAIKALSTASPKKTYYLRQVEVGSGTAHLVSMWKGGEKFYTA